MGFRSWKIASFGPEPRIRERTRIFELFNVFSSVFERFLVFWAFSGLDPADQMPTRRGADAEPPRGAEQKHLYRNQMSYPPATTSHHTTPHPPTYLGWLAQGGGSCFLPRLLAKIPPFLSHSGGSFLYGSGRNFFYRFLPSKMPVLGFRRGKTLPARARARCQPFCARVSAFFFTDFYRTKCVFWGFVEVKRCSRGPVSGACRFVRE